MHIALVLAAGNGTRMNSDIPKQFLTIYNKPLLAYTLHAFEKSHSIDQIVICADKNHLDIVEEIVKNYAFKKVIKIVEGGKTRKESSYFGLQAISSFAHPDDLVLIHDGARANISPAIIDENVLIANQYQVAVTALISQDTCISKEDGYSHVYPRGSLQVVQTPQTFPFSLIWNAHQAHKDLDISDDAQLIDASLIHFSKGSILNFKVTTPDDLKLFTLLKKEETWND